MNILDIEYSDNQIHNNVVANILESEVEYFKSKIQSEDCGHLHTTIIVLEERIKELRSKKK